MMMKKAVILSATLGLLTAYAVTLDYTFAEDNYDRYDSRGQLYKSVRVVYDISTVCMVERSVMLFKDGMPTETTVRCFDASGQQRGKDELFFTNGNPYMLSRKKFTSSGALESWDKVYFSPSSGEITRVVERTY
jgi:hypothetical protein